jgi:hypothetical protein
MDMFLVVGSILKIWMDRSRLQRKDEELEQKQTPRPAGERNGIWYVDRKEREKNTTTQEDEKMRVSLD